MRSIEYDIMASREDDHWWYNGLRRLTVDNLAEARIQGGRINIIDVGCGTGGCYRAIRKTFPFITYVGIDLELKALHYARKRGLNGLIQASVNQIPLRRQSADVIICLDVLCYASVCPRTALEQFYEQLRPCGLLILNLPAMGILRGQHDLAVGIHRRFRKGEMRSLLRTTGFSLVTSTYWNSLLFPCMAAWRCLSRAQKDKEPASDLARIPQWLDPVLGGILRLEFMIARWLSLPFGSSLFLVAQKTTSASE